MRHLPRLRSLSFISFDKALVALSLTFISIACPAIAGEVRENRFAAASETSTASETANRDGGAGTKGTPSDEEINVVEKGLKLARLLILNEHVAQTRAIEKRDLAELARLTKSLNQVQQCCTLIKKYGVQNFLPRLSFDNQIFIAEEGIARELLPYLSRTAESLKEHSEKVAEEEKLRQRRVAITRSEPATPKRREAEPASQPEKLMNELKSIERQLKENQRNGEPPRQALLDRLEEINQINQSRVKSVNRKSWQPGYTLSQRRAAAMTLLMRRGYTSTEAALTVRSMESEGLLPDPPKNRK